MTDQTFAEFETQARSAGFDEALERSYPAGKVVDTHTHPFSVDAIVVRGEMWLTQGEQTRHLQPGDRFELSLEEPHAERYGDAGATYWVARRNRRNA